MPDRLARFQREAQVLASLNYPGIAAIYGIEEAESTRGWRLSWVEGRILADRISQGGWVHIGGQPTGLARSNAS